jgi:hypothetical protein
MNNPLGRYWLQPNVQNIEIDDTHALMSKSDFDELKDYSCSCPSGVYAGKMWKCSFNDGWRLRWWSDLNHNTCECNQRIILIA